MPSENFYISLGVVSSLLLGMGFIYVYAMADSRSYQQTLPYGQAMLGGGILVGLVVVAGAFFDIYPKIRDWNLERQEDSVWSSQEKIELEKRKWDLKRKQSEVNEYIKSQEKDKKPDYTTQSEKPLEFDVTHEDNTGKIKVFISHKFVESDQKLARILQNHLHEHNIYGYLAERKREYDLVFSEKIKNDIQSSDYLIAIITKNSHFAPSIHQEIGYALGVKVPVRIMVEEQESKGVLIEGKDFEKFSRQNFEKYLENIIKDIQKIGIRNKLTEQEKEELVRNIYRPCYNKMHDIMKYSEFIDTIPDNPWLHLEPYLKIKIESDIQELFEEYEKERNIWHTMWMDFGNKTSGKRKEIGEMLNPIFATYFTVDQSGNMNIGGRLMTPHDWFLEYKDVLLNTKISSDKELQKILKDYALKKWGKRHSEYYDELKVQYPSFYHDLFDIIPKLVETVGADFTYQEMDSQRNILKKRMIVLTDALEDKLR